MAGASKGMSRLSVAEFMPLLKAKLEADMDNLTFPQLIPISRVSGLGVVLGRRWASVYRGLSLLRENLPSPHLRQDDVIGAVLLIRTQRLQTDWPRNEVSDL